MDKKKLVKNLQTTKTVKDFGSIVILFSSSIVQPAFSCFTKFESSGYFPLYPVLQPLS